MNQDRFPTDVAPSSGRLRRRATKSLRRRRQRQNNRLSADRSSMVLERLEDRLLLSISDPLVNVPGIASGSRPPDTVMDVGSNHVIQMVNATSFEIWDKHGTSLVGPTTFSDLWTDNPHITEDEDNLCEQRDRGDPIVVYDHLADRWVLSQFFYDTKDEEGNKVGNLGMCIAVSQTADPVGGVDGVASNGDEWYLYGFDTNEFPDYPKFGVWPDAYYVSTNESNLGIYAFDRAKMLAGDGTATYVRTDINKLGTADYRSTRILPADLDGPAPPPGTPDYFVRTVDDNQDNGDSRDRIEVYTATPDFVGGTISFNLVEDIDGGDGLAAFDIMACDRNGQDVRDCIPQPNEVDTIDALSNRPMMQLKFRDFGTHFSMVFNQTIDMQGVVADQTGHTPGDEVAGIRWYELRSTDTGANWDIQQQGDYADQPAGLSDDGAILHRWMGSAAIDQDGNIGVAYSIVNSDDANPVYPGLSYTGRRFDDALGALAQGEKVILSGTGPQGNGDGTVDPQRWGDYSALSVDPVDDCTFWYSAHVAGGRTQIASFRFDTCVPPDEFEPNDTLADAGILGSLPNVTLSNMSIHGPADVDFYKYTAHDTGMVIINVMTAAENDLELRVLDRSGAVIASDNVPSTILSGLEQYGVVLPVVGQEEYFIQVLATSEQFFTYDVEIENFAAPVPNSVWLDPLDDTGMSNSDNVTSEDESRVFIEADLTEFAARGIDILSPAEVTSGAPGAAVVVIVNGSEVGVAAPIAGTNNTLFQYTFQPGELSTTFIPAGGGGGLNAVKAAVRVYDPQTSQAQDRGSESEPLMLTLDPQPPTPSAPGMLASSDSGTLDTDNVTNKMSPAFEGTAEPRVKVRVFANGRLVGQSVATSDGRWEITVEPLADGVYDITTEVEDLAGNIGQWPVEEGPLQIEVDTRAPNTPYLDLVAVSDSGRSDEDNVTNDTTLTLTMTSTDPDQALHLLDTNYIFRIYVRPEAASGGVTGEELLIYDSSVDATIPAADIQDGLTRLELLERTMAALPDGLHNLKLEVEDRAGNISDDFLLAVVVDTAAYLGDGDLHPNSDSGVAGYTATNEDRITQDKSPLMFGVAEANNLVYVRIDDVPAGTGVALPEDGNDAFQPPADGTLVEGNWQILTNLNLADGEHSAVFTFEDLAGNQVSTEPLLFFVDTQGPQITNVAITGHEAFNLFNPKPTEGPTPLVEQLSIFVRDLPPRTGSFSYDAVFETVAENPGHYTLIGDHNGHVAVDSVDFVPDAVVPGQPARGTLIITLFEPLPDDRYTLVVSDSVVDVAGNQLDGENNAVQPVDPPGFPTGDGQPGGVFTARFTVDSRAELGVWAAGSVYVDTNGNFLFDPEGADGDNTNEDITYMLGFTSDTIFAGNFTAAAGGTADGFDKLAAYGRVGGAWRWLIDTDNNGVPNLVVTDPANVNGLAVAGNFDGNATNGDEVGLFTGSVWYFDTNHDFQLDQALASNMIGYPIVGDFDGDGVDDLGTWADDTFTLDLSSTDGVIDGLADHQFGFGFIGVRERPVAADMDGDGIDDLGLWVPDRSGATPAEFAEWYVLISGGVSITDRIVPNPQGGGFVVDFTPIPFGHDLFAQFGDEFGLPVVGNFDPPVVGQDPPDYQFMSFQNPDDQTDINGDGQTSPVDALLVINTLNDRGPRALPLIRSDAATSGAPFLDASGDFHVSALDALLVINRLNEPGRGAAEGEAAPAISSISVLPNVDQGVLDVAAPVDASTPLVEADEGSHVAHAASDALINDLLLPVAQPTTVDAMLDIDELAEFDEPLERLIVDIARDIDEQWNS